MGGLERPTHFPPATQPRYRIHPADGGEFSPVWRVRERLYFVNPHIHTPYTYQYNLSLQREVTRNMVAEINYVGSSAKGLTALQDVNPFDLSTPKRRQPVPHSE